MNALCQDLVTTWESYIEIDSMLRDFLPAPSFDLSDGSSSFTHSFPSPRPNVEIQSMQCPAVHSFSTGVGSMLVLKWHNLESKQLIGHNVSAEDTLPRLSARGEVEVCHICIKCHRHERVLAL